MANVGPSVWYCRDNGTIGWSAVTAWHTPWTPAAGTLTRQTAPTVGNERVFVCTTSNAVSGTEPTWVVTKGGLTTDNLAVWQECTGQPGVNGDLTNTPTWAQQHAFSISVTIGLIIQDAAGDCLFIAHNNGNIGATEPTWNKTAGATTVDNGVTWTSIGAPTNFGAWAAPHAKIQNLPISSTWIQPGNALYVGDDHAQTQASGLTCTFPGTNANPNYIYSIDHLATLPPSSTAYKAGASVTTTGNFAMIINGNGFYIDGITFNAGSGVTANGLTIGNSTGGWSKLDNCTLAKLGTNSATGAISLGTPAAMVELFNTTMQFGNVGDSLSTYNLIWRNTPAAIQGATLPTTLLRLVNNGNAEAILDGIDLSAITGTIIGAGAVTGFLDVQMSDCKINASATLSPTPLQRGQRVTAIWCDHAGTNYQQQISSYQGTLIPETTIVRTNGASDGTTSLSWNITTNANALWISPFESFPTPIWNTVTGANVTVTLHGIVNAASVPNNDQIWIEVTYFGDASSPQGSFANNTKANNLASGSALTADSTSAWDSLVTARANTTGYTTGQTIKVASNPGRVFWCTASGTSAGSEPAGYSTAVDGGSVTDGTATFRAGCRFLLAVTLSSPQPQLVGYLRAKVKAAQLSQTFYVDPAMVLS